MAAETRRRTSRPTVAELGEFGLIERIRMALRRPDARVVLGVGDDTAGLDGALAEFGAYVVGGNLSSGSRIVADLTLLGEVERDRLLTRAGARPGDLICVTGTLGRSAAGRAALDADLSGPEVDGAVRAH